MSQELLIKELCFDDVEKYVEHLARHFPEPGINGVMHSPMSSNEPLDKEQYIKRSQEGVQRQLHEINWERIWGLFDGNEIVGHVDLMGHFMSSMSHRARLGMGIEEKYRSIGYGKKLIIRALDWVKSQNNIEWVDLGVLSQNKAAIQLYESFGFKRTARIRDKFRVNGQSVDDILMTLPVASYAVIDLEKKRKSQKFTAISPLELQTKNVKIKPLQSVSWQMLAEHLLYPDSYYETQWGIKNPEDVRQMYEKNLRAFENKLMNPIVFLNLAENEILGMSSFMNIEQRNKMLEIGGTWIAQKWQRSFVNTETKYELLNYCFEVLNYNRVEFRIDTENHQSQAAIKRLGAQLDGIMKNRVINTSGLAREYAFYSITKEDWFNKVKQNILSLIKT